MRRVETHHDFGAWRAAARRLLAGGVPPGGVVFDDDAEQGALEIFEEVGEGTAGTAARVPRAFVALADRVACHRDPGRWALLYRVLWRLTHGEPTLLRVSLDEDVHALEAMDKAVRRDAHKMKAFVRFRRVRDAGGERYVAWHRPDHRIVRLVAPFFARRFGAAMRWTIFTPDESADWDGERVRLGPGLPARGVRAEEGLEDLWRTYYASIFNPARVKVRAMTREMPVRHWATLPEASIIDELLRTAPTRVEGMMARTMSLSVTAADFMPPEGKRTLRAMREASRGCEGCELYRTGTQTVFGEGPADARVVMVGEQPGDQEDLQGRPFVGPAGEVLDRGLAEAGIDRGTVYITNAVKHFRWEPRGKRRLHRKPGATHIGACRPWLEGELGTIKPGVVVCLGATAAQALMGAGFRVTRDRGTVFRETPWAPALVATIHPSAILRMPDEESRGRAFAEFVSDLRVVRGELAA